MNFNNLKFKRRLVNSRRLWRRFSSYFEFKFTGRWMFYSFLIGIVAGVGAILFYFLQEWIQAITIQDLSGYSPPAPGGEGKAGLDYILPLNRWWILILPAVGGLISGLLVYIWAPEAEGHGTDAVIKAFHHERGLIRSRVPVIKMLASAVTIGTGGSAGREGPIAQIGAGFGSLLATKLKLNDSDRRIMVVSGIAGGIGSIFMSPIGGAIFAVEALYKDDMETEGLVPAITSSIIAYSVFASIFGWKTIFSTEKYVFHNPLELPIYIGFALICALLGIVYVKVFYGLHDRIFGCLKIPKHVIPAIGGLLVGIIGFFFPYVLGSGYGWIQMAIYGKLTIGLMILAALLKILATSFTISSGGSGGVFAPSLFMGAMLGGAYGSIMQNLFPNIITQPTAFVLVGMAAFFAGAANVPVSVTIMISEMTGSYSLLVPLIFTSTIAYFVARKWSIYRQQVKNHAESPAHRGDLIVDLLNEIPVSAAFRKDPKLPKIPNNLPIEKILPLFAEREEDCFPVVNQDGKITGILSMDTLRAVIGDEGIDGLILAEDIKTPLVTLTPEESLNEALAKFLDTKYSSIPVVDSKDPNKILGSLSYRDLISAYDQALINWKS
ncbi:MAG: chloride channel protein [Calditrichaeota bacterium]|nr:MAG: chloride channel protein [Calditrichota bacterium]